MTCSKKRALIKLMYFVVLVLIAFMSFRFNLFNAAEREFFDGFQRDSESLVIGRLIADKYNLKTQKNGFFLGRIGIFSYDGQYSVLKYRDGILPNKLIIPLNFNDANWKNGISKDGMRILLQNREVAVDLEPYIGKQVIIDGITRYIKKIEYHDQYIHLVFDNNKDNTKKIMNTNEITVIGGPINLRGIQFKAYRNQQVGTQGPFFSKLYKIYNRISALYTINCMILSCCVVFLYYQYKNVISNSFAICLFISLILSPWMVSFARNLYWIPFSWFLPSVLSLFLLKKKEKYMLVIFFVLITCTFAFKCLTGYEYLSSIILFASAPFLYKFCVEKENKAYYLKCFIMVCMAGVCAFIIVLIYHAGLRGDTILQGIQDIYEKDVKRRTYGEAGKFAAVYGPSLNAGVWSVVKQYIYGWHTDVLPGIAGKNFFLFVCMGAISLFFTARARFGMEKEKCIAFIIFMLPALSWFVLGKAHSYIHTHMNFVLWYFGFIAVVMYCIVDGVMLAIRTRWLAGEVRL